MRRTLGSGYMVLSGAAHTPAREDPLTPRQISRCRCPCDFLATSSVPPYGVSQVTSPFQVTRRRKLGLTGQSTPDSARFEVRHDWPVKRGDPGSEHDDAPGSVTPAHRVQGVVRVSQLDPVVNQPVDGKAAGQEETAVPWKVDRGNREPVI